MDETFEMDEERLELWFFGQLSDEELTLDEIEWLEDAVWQAVTDKVTRRIH
jgi:hypothetical protein